MCVDTQYFTNITEWLVCKKSTYSSWSEGKLTVLLVFKAQIETNSQANHGSTTEFWHDVNKV